MLTWTRVSESEVIKAEHKRTCHVSLNNVNETEQRNNEK